MVTGLRIRNWVFFEGRIRSRFFFEGRIQIQFVLDGRIRIRFFLKVWSGYGITPPGAATLDLKRNRAYEEEEARFIAVEQSCGSWLRLTGSGLDPRKKNAVTKEKPNPAKTDPSPSKKNHSHHRTIKEK